MESRFIPNTNTIFDRETGKESKVSYWADDEVELKTVHEKSDIRSIIDIRKHSQLGLEGSDQNHHYDSHCHKILKT